ncbi:YebG family protein [Psychrosphaera ytuae]|uniref:YebG family protein n=1 Tax=Psychrosphaera ytuae TaxID=2820710 RepID=A0A975DD44_9GAMM|nr:YebG family protein [Psychrosphaera ytuae]QTH64713.1 YebG family protein [Psychrosphaera ytuae]
MAVETRYVVIRTDKSNKEQEVMTFTDKRAADEYDKMLDMADGMFELLQSNELQGELKLADEQCEALSIFLAKQREEVLIALQAKKKPVSKANKSKSSKAKSENQAQLDINDEVSTKKIQSESESDVHSDDIEDNLIDFVIEKDDAA